VLATIFVGVATPTEGGAMGAVGSMLLAAAKRVADRNPARFNLGIARILWPPGSCLPKERMLPLGLNDRQPALA